LAGEHIVDVYDGLEKYESYVIAAAVIVAAPVMRRVRSPSQRRGLIIFIS
jgi:hypothetical protein